MIGKKAGGGGVDPGFGVDGFDPLNKHPDMTLSNGNLTCTKTEATASFPSAFGSNILTPTDQKAFIEFRINGFPTCNSGGLVVGITKSNQALNQNIGGSTHVSAGSQCCFTTVRGLVNGGAENTTLSQITSANVAAGGLVATAMIAVDFLNSEVWIGTKGVWDGNPVEGTDPIIDLFVKFGASWNDSDYSIGGSLNCQNQGIISVVPVAERLVSLPAGFSHWG